MELNLLQIVVLLGLLSGAVTEKKPRCYRSHELDDAAQRKLQLHYPQPPERAASGSGSSACPLDLYAHLQRDREYSGRSLSPWRYETVALPDHYPSSYVGAVCLCSGCIQFRSGCDRDRDRDHDHDRGVFQSFDFNSVTVNQSRVFLRRQLCDDRQSYQLVPVSINVPVACTCVRPVS